MKRPLFWCSVLFLTGIFSAYLLPQLSAAVLFVSSFLFFIPFVIIKRKLYASVIAFMIILSFSGGNYIMSAKNSPRYMDSLINKTATLTLKVAEYPELKDDYCVYICDVLKVDYKGNCVPSSETIRLTHKDTKNLLTLGDVFTSKCKITKPSLSYNRGGFDYKLYLKTQDIFFTGYTLAENISPENNHQYSFTDYFKLLNNHLCKNIDSAFKEDDALFLKAMLLGNKTDMPASYYSNFKKSGLSHVVAVSGMHLSYIVMLLFFMKKALKIKSRAFSIFAIGFIFCFMIITGMSASVMRAGIMLFFVLSGDLFTRKADPKTSLSFAAALIAAFNPYAMFSSSFILSFSATLGILLFANPIVDKATPRPVKYSQNIFARIARIIISVLSVSLSAQLATFPFIIYMFNEVSLWALLSNLLITPLCPLILGLGFLFCLLSLIFFALASFLAKFIALFTITARFIINIFSSLDCGIIILESTDFLFMFATILFMIVITCFLYNKKKLLPLFSSLLIIALAFNIVNINRTSAKTSVSFINVGQGDASLITIAPNINILIDGGKYDYSEDSDVSTSTLNSYLKKRGITHINFMILSHPHDDHAGGLFPVLDTMKVDCLVIPDKFGNDEVASGILNKAKAYNVPVYKTGAKDSIEISDNIKIEVLMPDKYISEKYEAGNDTSLILKFTYYDTSFLFTGDAQEATENHLVKTTNPQILDVDVLKVGHHGSKTSTTDLLLSKTTPKFSFIPVGKNTFGHPSDEVLKRLKDSKTTVFRADLNRNVIFTLTPKGINNIIYN